MAIYLLMDKIDAASVNATITALDGEEGTLYLCSWGGQIGARDALTSYINKRTEALTIIATEYIGSAAFDLMLSVKCAKYVLPHTIGMTHKAKCTYEVHGEAENKRAMTMAGMKSLEIINRIHRKKFKDAGATSAELKDYDEEREVYIVGERLARILGANILDEKEEDE